MSPYLDVACCADFLNAECHILEQTYLGKYIDRIQLLLRWRLKMFKFQHETFMLLIKAFYVLQGAIRKIIQFIKQFIYLIRESAINYFITYHVIIRRFCLQYGHLQPQSWPLIEVETTYRS